MAGGIDRGLLRAWCQAVDEGPFHALAVGERIGFDNLEMHTTLTFAAAATERVRLRRPHDLADVRHGLGGEIARHPRCRERWAPRPGGRGGGRRHDYDRAERSFAGRHQRLDDQVAELRRIWAGGDVDGVPVGPAPVQSGGPPIFASAMGPKSTARAARWADGNMGFSLAPDTDDHETSIRTMVDAWAAAGRAERPYVSTSFWYSLGDGAAAELDGYARRYLGIFGDEAAAMMASMCSAAGAEATLAASNAAGRGHGRALPRADLIGSRPSFGADRPHHVGSAHARTHRGPYRRRLRRGPRWHDERLWFSDFYRQASFRSVTTANVVNSPSTTSPRASVGCRRHPSVRLDDRQACHGRFSRRRPVVHADLSQIARTSATTWSCRSPGTPTWATSVSISRIRHRSRPRTSPISPRRCGSSGRASACLSQRVGDHSRRVDVDRRRDVRRAVHRVRPRRRWSSRESTGMGLGARCITRRVCLDADGAIWMSDFVGQRFARVHEGGEVSAEIPVDGAAVACMLGGPTAAPSTGSCRRLPP